MTEKEYYLPAIVGKGYRDFWNCHERYRVLKGGKASKKSATTALWYIYHLMKYPDANLLVVRGVLNTHADSTFAQLRWAINRLGVSQYWEAIKSPLEIRYKPTGQKILFRGFDDPLRLASVTVDKGYLCWVWIEEAFEIASEKEFDQFDRSAPRGYVPEPLFKQTTLTFNPWSEGHWLKKRFFDDSGKNVWTGTTNYLCNEFLDVADIDGYEEMKRKNPRLYAVAGLGEWGVADGLIYDNWEVAPFDVREVEEQDGAWKFKHVFGLDYGYTNDPTAFIAAAVNKTDGVMYIYDEHYEKRMLNSDIAQMIKEKGYAKERIRADSAEPKSNEELRRLGIGRVMPAEKGRDSIVNGISRIQEYRLVVHPRCRNTVAELSSYHWITDKTGSGKNQPADSDNHLMDALRYAALDLKHFRPKKEAEEKAPRGGRPHFSAGLTPEDLKGGWS